MDEHLADRVVNEVLRRLSLDSPAALLLGDRPPDTLGYRLTDQAPYEAVLIGSLTASELLRFADGPALDALLRGLPVFLYEGGLTYRAHAATANRALWARLMGAERALRQWGVRFYGGRAERTLITAAQARQLLSQGRRPGPGAILTPLAREILEGGGRS